MKLSFIGIDQGAAVGFDQPGNQLLDLALDDLELACGVGRLLLGAGLPHVPMGLEHGVSREEQFLRGLHRIDQALERALQLKLLDVLAGHLAALGEAPIVGVALAMASTGPSCRHGAVTAGAVDQPPQRKIAAEVGPVSRYRLTGAKTLFNLEEGLIGDERLVLGGHPVNIPLSHAHIPGIERLGQDLRHLLRVDGAKAVLGEDGALLKEALHFGLRLEPAFGIAFQGLLDDARQRLNRNQHLARMPGHAVVAVANGRRESPIAVGGAGHHPVFGLLGVLLALVLGDRGEKVFDQHAVGILAKLDGRALQLAACGSDGGAQLDMRLKPARKAADVVDDDDVGSLAAMLLEEGQHGEHASPLDDAARRTLVAEHFDHLEALRPRIVAAAGFLRAQARAARDLLGVRYAAIDDGF